MISAPIIEYLKKGMFTVLELIVAVYLFVILLTYTGNDPSWSHISSDMNTINNMGGAMGAWLSDLLYSFFGFGAWWLLACLLYESLLMWWDNKPTLWLLRLVAYVFLLLGGSALAAQLVSLVQHFTHPTTVELQGVAGGIIGLELQIRLAQLLSAWGSAVFLSVFVLITATFAFNIHWLSVYDKLKNLSWLGSGVKAPESERQQSNESLLSEDATRQDTPAASEKIQYGQLPLELAPAATSGAASSTAAALAMGGRLSHALSDFLSKSGLGASIKAKVAVDKAFAAQQKPQVAPQSQAQPQTTKKVIPPTSPEKAVDEPALETPKVTKVTPVPDTMDMADVWLADYDTAVENELPPVEVAIEQVSAQQLEPAINAPTISEATINKPSVNEPVTNQPVAAMTDMTPTNTPPAHPQAAPTVKHTPDNMVSANPPSMPNEPAISAQPTISFAVPEGDSSNHIIDMMPEEDSAEDISAPVMPHISDDAAFSHKSRSMQTAKYRAALTPIPELSLLDKPDPNRKPSYTEEELEQLSELLEIKLQEFNVKAYVVNAIPGPVVTRFEVELAAGVKASKVTGISRDLARSLSMASLRVVEVIPGKPYIGIEVPNKQREMVRLIELLNTDKFKDPNAQISMAMGKDIGGKAIITDLARAPHMLVAGTTGSGKSVLVNSMLLSMLLKYTPNELRLILIDPKQLELANYNDIPHLLTPVVTDMTEAASALSWCVAEMERRYYLMSMLKVRKLNEFNKKVIAAEKAGTPMLDPLWRPNDNVSISQAPKLKTLPMIVIVADEFADMIMQVGKQAEELITRLAQKSRAAGIHLMLATQRPSVDVITGLIKANIPVRAALRVNSKVDSRTILDSGGAEDMLGNGDMLFLGPGQIEPDRVHGAYVSDEEVNRVCDAWRERGAPDYIDNMAGNFELSSVGSGSTGSPSGEDDDLYNEAVAFIMETRKVSASSIQRKFSIGYNRAARIVDSMEEAGLVSPMGKSGKRELLM